MGPSSQPVTSAQLAVHHLAVRVIGAVVALACTAVWPQLIDVRFGAHNGLKSDIAPCPKSAKGGSRSPSFDHLVGEGEQ
jgi:hypothetical protein